MNPIRLERAHRVRRVVCFGLLGGLSALAAIALRPAHAPVLADAAAPRHVAAAPAVRAADVALGTPIAVDRQTAAAAAPAAAPEHAPAAAPSEGAALGEVHGWLQVAPGWPAPASGPCSLHLDARCGAQHRRIALPPAAGPFRVALPSGRWTVRAIAEPGHASAHAVVLVDPARPAALRLGLQRATELRGVVRDAAGEPLADHPVTARPLDAEGAPPIVVCTDGGGRFTIGDIRVRDWELRAGAPDRAAGPGVVASSRTPGGAGIVNLVAADVGAVRLHLQPALAAPLVGIVVRLEPPAGAGRERRAVTDVDGTVDFAGLACGRWTATVQSAAGWCVHQPVDVRTGQGAAVLHLAPRGRATP
ncbi:MAG: hypothetical protein AB7O97_08470 [Planctomycetota bacterium]